MDVGVVITVCLAVAANDYCMAVRGMEVATEMKQCDADYGVEYGNVKMSWHHRVLFLSHGGGPLPLLGDVSHAQLLTAWREVAATVAKPSAIVVISAHWEEPAFTVTTAARPPLVYDYYGFPDEAYRITYPCVGQPALAQAVHDAVVRAGLPAQLDAQRGLDHGVFVPLAVLYPEADIPCVQLSLHHSLDPAMHIALGRALATVRHENLLIMGSGFTFHNMRAFMEPASSDAAIFNIAFEQWLADTCCNPLLDEPARAARLVQWEQAPGARFCHPREEHLLPLQVCYGVAQRVCAQHRALNVLNRQCSQFLW